MLIYNFQKEFLGIDEKDLISLGYKNLAELQIEVSDFADLFVKTPGYIHNFKHVHWIDFITCAESYEESKVIINVNNKNYKSTLTISTTFLVDNPSQKAYIVNLNNLRELTHQENEAIANDIIERPVNNSVEEPKKIFDTPQYTESPNVTTDPYEAPTKIEEDDLTPKEIKIDIDMDDEKLTIQEDFTEDIFISDPVDTFEEEEKKEVITPTKATTIVQESFDNGYTYNPSVASDELGLPLDLIEEFIQDFIAQAKEFKKKLYTALDEADLNNIKILSHKLKGVAANLRIEDALETLTTMNTSSDFNVIKENLDIFYNIISKLNGEEINVQKELIVEEATPLAKVEHDSIDELALDFKDDNDDLYSDPVEVPDHKIPEKLKLEDDLFLETKDDEEIILTQEKQEIEDISKIMQYSKESIANEIGIDSDSFNSLFQDYLDDSKTLLKSIQEAINNEDYEMSKEEGFKLKGMSDNMRINSFSDELETIIHSSNIEEIAQAISKIEADLAQLSTLGV